MPRLSPAVLALSLIAAVAATPAAANPGAFVASYGSDANTATNCGQANPCRSFAAAHSVVDPSGLILALDGAGYGIVTITKSVTIAASPGFYARMGNSTGSVITIATAGVIVTLRGLTIESTGASYGINMSNGAKLSIENCVISNFTAAGVYVNAAADVRIIDTLVRDSEIGVYLLGGAAGTLSNSRILNNAGIGLWVSATTAAVTKASLNDSIVTGGNTGIHSGSDHASGTGQISVVRSTISHSSYGAVLLTGTGTAVISIGNSAVTNTGTALYNQGIGTTLETLGNNTVRQNNLNTSGTISTVPQL